MPAPSSCIATREPARRAFYDRAGLWGARGPCPALRLVLLSVAFSSTALGGPDDSPVRLVWDAPSPCPNAETVLAQIKRSLGSAPTAREQAVVEAHVSLGEHGRWNATLRTTTRAGSSERALEAESCAAIATAIALVSAVAVEGAEAPPPATAPPVSPPPTPSTPVPNPPHEHSSAALRSQLLLGADVAANEGVLPGLRFGGELAGGWGLRVAPYQLRALASASLFPSTTTGVPGRNGERGIFELWTATARACGTRAFGSIELGPCLGGEMDAMSASGQGTRKSLPSTPLWGSLVGSVLGAVDIGPAIALFVRVDGVLAPTTPTFVVEVQGATGGPIVVHQPASLTGRGAVGVEVRFF